ncbi:MAG: coenzyme F420-0:L-glutamate ligase [Pseudomonadota bacterium]
MEYSVANPISAEARLLTIIPITGLPEIQPGDDLGALLRAYAPDMVPGDVLVVTQKIVSKAEGRFVDLASVTPGDAAIVLAGEVNKDARLVELVLRESAAIVRQARHVLITRHSLGHVMANAGIDASNIGQGSADRVLLLPQDPDASAARIAAAFDPRPAVLIADSFGRPWRVGVTNVAIGLSGMAAVLDKRGEIDRDGRMMQVTQIALADAIAAAAGLVMGEAAEGIPAAIVRGAGDLGVPQPASAVLRPADEDLFQ